MRTIRSTALTMIAWGLLGATAPYGVADAAKSPERTARSCRTGISRAFERLARLGFAEVDRCQRKRAAGRTDRDCTTLRTGEGSSTAFRRWQYRTGLVISVRCPIDTPARDPFPLKEFSAGLFAGDPTSIVPQVATAVEASAHALQGGAVAAVTGGAVSGAGDACLAGVAAARTLVANATMHEAMACQRKLDRSAGDFAPLAPECEAPPPDAVVREAAGRIAGACTGAVGPDVGTCAPLPGCVIDAATATGHELARLAFGQCGNGIVEGTEQCDDGNDVAGDGCDRCTAPACGDGKVEGEEECDDGNGIDHDTCTECRLPICGDGIVDVGAEACDDGNDTPFDGCTDCQSDPVTCSSEGVLATVRIDYDPARFVDVAGMRVRIRYAPESLSIPGTFVGPTINQRVRNLTGVAGSFGVADRDFLPSEDAPDGVDDTVQMVIAVASGRVPPGPFASIRFDCSDAEARASQIQCVVDDVVDPFLNQVDDAVTAEQTSCTIELETAPVQ